MTVHVKGNAQKILEKALILHRRQIFGTVIEKKQKIITKTTSLRVGGESDFQLPHYEIQMSNVQQQQKKS